MGTFFLYASILFFFAILYAIKGGWLGKIPGFNHVRESNRVLDRLLDGKAVSTIGVLVFMGWLCGPLGGLIWAVAWLAAVAPSMGEEAGGVGRPGFHTGPYIEDGYGVSYAWKKGAQRGVWMGACFAGAAYCTGFEPCLLMVLFSLPAISFYYAGSWIQWKINATNSWAIGEPLIGLFCIGLPIAILKSLTGGEG